MYWLAAKLKYLQSWEDEVIYFDRFLTVLEGKSNSGKSVLIKALSLGINYKEYTPRERRSIVRDHHKYPDRKASLMIITSDYYKVKFSYTVDSVYTSLTRPDGSKKRYRGTADEEVLEVLGIKMCSGSSRILNVLDNERPMAFDNVNDKEGASIMQLYLEHIDLNNRKAYAQEIKKSLKKSTNVALCERDNFNRSLAEMKVYGDLDEASKDLQELEILSQKDKALIELIIPLNNLAKLDDKLPSVSDKEFKEAKILISKLGIINKLNSYFRTLISEDLSRSKPVIPEETLKDFNLSINFLDTLTKVDNAINNILNLRELPVVDLSDLEKHCKFLDCVEHLQQKLESYVFLQQSIVNEVDKKYFDELEMSITKLNFYSELESRIRELLKNIEARERIEEEYLTLKEQLEEFKKEHPECPTCGQSLEGVEL